MPQRSIFLRLSVACLLCLLSACAAANNSTVPVPAVSGEGFVQTIWKNEASLTGDSIYLVPLTTASKDFFNRHKDDYYIDEKLLTGLPGTISTSIGPGNKYTFKQVPSGSYFIYWQFSHDKIRNPLDNSDSNAFERITLSPDRREIRFPDLR